MSEFEDTAAPTDEVTVDDEPAESTAVDLDAIAADLADVEIAMARLDNGSYWTDEVTGEALPESLLELNPIARRLPLA